MLLVLVVVLTLTELASLGFLMLMLGVTIY